VGLQIIGPPLGEETVLRVAHAFEEVTDHHLEHPDVSAWQAVA
jgi:aspartyl-tRNA(Asn)/glutamyl-tRNA(Gln) amidotransferase subunit A